MREVSDGACTAEKESKELGSIDGATKKLELVRYMYSLGMEQSRQAEPMNTASLLWLHRAAEVFLELASERLGVSGRTQTFAQRLSAVSSRLGRPLSRQESVRAMDGAETQRRRGTPPSSADVESFRASTAGFLRENAPLVFGLEFGRELLVDSVRYERVRTRLRDAQDCMENGDLKGAMKEISAAFHTLFHEYMFDVRTLKYTSKGKFIAQVKEKAEIMREVLDYEKWKEFQGIAPTVVMFDKEYTVGGKRNHNMEDCAFCFNFVIESAVSFQNLGHV